MAAFSPCTGCNVATSVVSLLSNWGENTEIVVGLKGIIGHDGQLMACEVDFEGALDGTKVV